MHYLVFQFPLHLTPENTIDQVSYLHEKPITITMSIVSNNYRGTPWEP